MTQRPIKFRAWDGDANRMIYEVIPMPEPNSNMFVCPVFDNRNPAHVVYRLEKGSRTPGAWQPYEGDGIVEQYTGLKDKNGVEVYEGDIVGFYFMAPDETWDGDRILIEWDNAKASFKTPLNYLSDYPVKVAPQSMEVIGNVHQNPDLLTPPETKNQEQEK